MGLGRDKLYWMERYQKNELEIQAFLEHEYFASKVGLSQCTQKGGTLTLFSALEVGLL